LLQIGIKQATLSISQPASIPRIQPTRTKHDREHAGLKFAALTDISCKPKRRNSVGEKTSQNCSRRTTMKLFSENIEDLRTLYLTNLRKALDMEQKITKALPTMIEKSTDPQLASAFRNHLTETQGHVSKVERLIRDASGDLSAGNCKAISALITEAEDNIKDAADASIRDITLIASAQQVEHHEIAVYGTLRSWAELLGQDGAANTLESILEEEKKADELLTTISDSVNTTAETRTANTTRV
jgi:ferritin-like metal-binding protein YciE